MFLKKKLSNTVNLLCLRSRFHLAVNLIRASGIHRVLSQTSINVFKPVECFLMFNGLNLSLGNLSRLSNAQTRSISPENFTGEKGKGGMATVAPVQIGRAHV